MDYRGGKVWFDNLSSAKLMGKLILLSLLLSSCSTRFITRAYERELIWYMNSTRYVKDMRTGLCYVVGDAYNSVQVTCVPCDSLKGVRLITIKPIDSCAILEC